MFVRIVHFLTHFRACNCAAQRAGRVDCHRQGTRQQTSDHRHHLDRSRLQRRQVGRFWSHYCFSIHPKMVTCPFVFCSDRLPLIIFCVFFAHSVLDILTKKPGTAGRWFLSISRETSSESKGPSALQKCSRNGNLRAECLTHHCLTVSACIFACQSSDTWDIRDILDEQ